MLITIFPRLWHGICSPLTAKACPEQSRGGAKACPERSRRDAKGGLGEPGFVPARRDYAVAGDKRRKSKPPKRRRGGGRFECGMRSSECGVRSERQAAGRAARRGRGNPEGSGQAAGWGAGERTRKPEPGNRKRGRKAEGRKCRSPEIAMRIWRGAPSGLQPPLGLWLR